MTIPEENAGAAMVTLADWIGTMSAMPVTPVTRAAPVEDGRIEIRLAAMVPRPATRSLDHRLDRLSVDYLVTWRMPDPIVEADLMSDLAFALAQDGDGFEIADEADAAEAASRLHIGPLAGVLVRCELARDRRLPRGPRVRHPAVTRIVPLAEIEGVVLGPGNMPIAGATICIAGETRVTTTDPRGRFRFAAPGEMPLHLRVAARGVTTEETVSPGALATINLSAEI